MCDDGAYDNPFSTDHLGGMTQNVPGLRSPSDGAGTDSPLNVTPEIWSGKNVYDISIPLHQMNEGYAGAVARNWGIIAGKLSDRHQAFLQFIGSRDVNHWQGEGNDAANDAMRNYAGALLQLAQRADLMSTVVQHGADTVNRTKNSIPTEAEINKGIAPLDEAQQRSTLNDLALHAETVMTTVYNAGVTETAAAAPVFGAPTQRSNPDQTLGPSGPGGFGGGGGGGGGSMPSGTTPSIPLLDNNTNTRKATIPTSASPSSTLPSSLTSGLSQASNLGQSALGQAQNAASKLPGLSTSPLTTPTGLHALNAAKKGGLAALGKMAGGGRGTGGGAGGAGAAKLGGLSKALTDAEKTALSRGMRSAMDAEKAVMSAARGASPTGAAGPMGAGGGRGAGGEDKDHKANKFLRTTLNGEVLIGVPPVVTAAVIKES